MNRFIDRKALKKAIEEFTLSALEIKDMFIVTNKSNVVLEVFDDADKLLKYLIQKKNFESDYNLTDYYTFLYDFIKDTNKFRTYDKKVVYKYEKTKELGTKKQLEKLENISKDSKVQQFLRVKKLNRII